MKFAKLINGNISFPPKNKGSVLNYDRAEELLRADGYKEYYEESELGCHIYGAIDEEILGDSYSVYAMVDDGEGNADSK